MLCKFYVYPSTFNRVRLNNYAITIAMFSVFFHSWYFQWY